MFTFAFSISESFLITPIISPMEGAVVSMFKGAVVDVSENSYSSEVVLNISRKYFSHLFYCYDVVIIGLVSLIDLLELVVVLQSCFVILQSSLLL